MSELNLPKQKRKEIIEFLTKMTQGTQEGYESKKDSQLYAIYKHVTEERNRYIKDIRAFERSQHIDGTEIEEFNKFSNKELREIGEEYGIYEPSKNTQLTQPHSLTSKTINNQDIECVERRIEEVRAMFGLDADLMSDDELHENGIILEYSSYSRKYSEEKVNLIRAMIKIIVQSGLLTDDFEPYNENILEYSSYERIKELYEKAREIKPTIMQLHELELKYIPKSGQ